MSDTEKVKSSEIQREEDIGVAHLHGERSDLPADPDAGLSSEEKAEIVSWSCDAHPSCRTALTILQDRKLVRRLDFKLIPWVRQVCTLSWV